MRYETHNRRYIAGNKKEIDGDKFALALCVIIILIITF